MEGGFAVGVTFGRLNRPERAGGIGVGFAGGQVAVCVGIDVGFPGLLVVFPRQTVKRVIRVGRDVDPVVVGRDIAVGVVAGGPA